VQTVPPGFTFAAKLAREITHERRLVGCDDVVAEFFRSMEAFGDALEAVLVQLGPDFSPDERGALFAFVERLPAGFPIALELRDPRWFAEPLASDVRAVLTARNIALALTDAPFVPLDTMLAGLAEPTADFAYLRWIGVHDAVARFDRVVFDRSAAIARWAKAIAARPPRVKRVCGYVNNHYAGHAPATVRALYAALGIAHDRPARIVQGSLF